MNADAHIRVVLEVFAAIEQRDAARFQAHTHPGVTICWPPPLPSNAGVPGRQRSARHRRQGRWPRDQRRRVQHSGRHCANSAADC